MPALSVRLIVPPSPIVAGKLYTVDCQVKYYDDAWDNNSDDQEYDGHDPDPDYDDHYYYDRALDHDDDFQVVRSQPGPSIYDGDDDDDDRHDNGDHDEVRDDYEL